MNVHRFYLPPPLAAAHPLVLDERQSHHACSVLRLRGGDRVRLTDGAGAECLCEIVVPNRRRTVLRLLESHWVAPLEYQLTLVQAVTKPKSMDLIVQKATELGVRRIVPIFSERTLAFSAVAGSGSKSAKWRSIALEALKQCGSAWLPAIEEPVTLTDYLARHETDDLSLVASLLPTARHPRSVLDAFRSRRGGSPVTLAVWVGPEGDFAAAELDRIVGAGAQPVRLGRLILRSETAALYCLAVLNYELQAPVAAPVVPATRRSLGSPDPSGTA